jgi:hypothetical protein
MGASITNPGTRFTGPLLAGPIFDTTGTTPGADISDVGSAVLGQVQAGVTQASGATTICIPAGSKIVSIQLMVTTAWTGVATTLGVGSTASATAFTAASAVAGGALGLVTVVPGTGATQIGNWDNVGATDVLLQLTSTNTGAGVGTLLVTYIQQANLAS